MLNSTDRIANERSERAAAAKSARRAEEASIVAGLQTVLEGDEQLLGFARGVIAGGLKGRLNIGPEAFFAPYINVGLTERRIVLQHLHGETGKLSEILPHFFPLSELQGVNFADIETYGAEPAGRLVLLLANGQSFRIRLKGEGNFAGARALADVFQSLTTVGKGSPGPTQRLCISCKHLLDSPTRFCPYCGARQQEGASADKPTTSSAPPESPNSEKVSTTTVGVAQAEPDLLDEALAFLDQIEAEIALSPAASIDTHLPTLHPTVEHDAASPTVSSAPNLTDAAAGVPEDVPETTILDTITEAPVSEPVDSFAPHEPDSASDNADITLIDIQPPTQTEETVDSALPSEAAPNEPLSQVESELSGHLEPVQEPDTADANAADQSFAGFYEAPHAAEFSPAVTPDAAPEPDDEAAPEAAISPNMDSLGSADAEPPSEHDGEAAPEAAISPNIDSLGSADAEPPLVTFYHSSDVSIDAEVNIDASTNSYAYSFSTVHSEALPETKLPDLDEAETHAAEPEPHPVELHTETVFTEAEAVVPEQEPREPEAEIQMPEAVAQEPEPVRPPVPTGRIRAHFHINHPSVKFNEIIYGRSADEVVYNLKARVVSELKFPLKLAAMRLTPLEFAQEIVSKYNHEERQNLPRPGSCKEFLTTVEAIGFATVEMETV